MDAEVEFGMEYNGFTAELRQMHERNARAALRFFCLEGKGLLFSVLGSCYGALLPRLRDDGIIIIIIIIIIKYGRSGRE